VAAHQHRRRYAWLTLGWLVLIFAASSIPGEGLAPAATILRADKLIHFGVYMILGVLLEGWLRRPWLTTLLGTMWGASDELHQWFVPGRFVEVADLLADAAGVMVGALGKWWSSRERRQ
jgi:VanZ family protein